MKNKNLLSVILTLVLSFALAFTLIACGEEPAPENPNEEVCTAHIDTNGDHKCDKCGADVTPEAPECTEHKDDDGDGKCDTCGADVTPEAPECTEHKDENGDNKCDTCGADLTPEAPECTEHKDENGDGKCDECDAEVTPDEPTKSETTLIENGKGKFNFVVTTGASSEINKSVMLLVQELSKLGVEVENLSDGKNNIGEVEVLIGEISTRGEEYQLDAHAFGYEGYCVKVIGKRVLILGGSDEALVEAIEVFKKEILGITKKTEKLTTVVMTEAQNIEVIQDDYDIKSVTVAGNDLRDYVITVNKDAYPEFSSALSIQGTIYKKTGFWLPIVQRGEADGKYIDILLTTAKTCTSTEKGFIAKVTDGNILMDCGFKNKISEAVGAFIGSQITNKKDAEISLKEGFTYEKEDYKNIYYEDFGAKGDGYTDDFFAIAACHKEANAFGHTVNANKNATYYLGKGSEDKTIVVQTDTSWNGCKFIFDDREILPRPRDEQGNTIYGTTYDEEFETSIFSVISQNDGTSYTSSNLPITTLKEGATNIGFAPGCRSLVKVYNSTTKHFIRFGGNADNGQSQTEILMVEADGTIDPTTPVQWNYDVITSIYVYPRNDDPIVIDGGGAFFQTYYNLAPSYYDYYSRNIHVSRANVTIKNIEHDIVMEDGQDHGAPYSGFISLTDCDNILVDNITFEGPEGYKTMGSGGIMVGMGSYALHANASNNVLWQNCTQTNFFQEDGGIKFDGHMGTNYCKNLAFDNMFVMSFDAHKGTYNATVKNSTCEHLNFIGEGLIYMENVTMHANATQSAMSFRSDYGSTWQGEVYIDGLNFKYYSASSVQIAKSEWNNHFFGYITYLPEKVTLKNVTTTKIGFKVEGGVRTEWDLEKNAIPVHLYRSLNSYTTVDISDPNMNTIVSEDPLTEICTCETFNDTDGNGICNNPKCAKPKTTDPYVNRNPYVPTKEVYIENCPGVTFVFPNTPQFKYMKVYLEGEEVDWQITGKVTVPAE